MMLLAAEWAGGRTAPPPLYVATVDHGLREDLRGEAEMVARWAAALSLPHALLVWDASSQIRIQERAREARYELLFEYAARIGADHVMTAHHADDQAETILFRLLRGTGVSGLSGMARSSERSGLVLARPLLAVAKADLAALCELRAHPFFDDPSNNDPACARTWMRRLGGLLADEGLAAPPCLGSAAGPPGRTPRLPPTRARSAPVSSRGASRADFEPTYRRSRTSWKRSFTISYR